MHSRIFYYTHINSIEIPYTGYKEWLRAHQEAKIWEWDLLDALCTHRDKSATSSNSSTPIDKDSAVAEKQQWMQDLFSSHHDMTNPSGSADSTTTLAWMAAAPKSDLYVDRDMIANNNDGSAQVPYPEQFAKIIQAVQSGEQIEGIIEIPDIVARNPVSIHEICILDSAYIDPVT